MKKWMTELANFMARWCHLVRYVLYICYRENLGNLFGHLIALNPFQNF